MRKKGLLLSIALVIIATLGLSVFTTAKSVSALSAGDWQAGRIIDDNVFTNKDAMSVAEIQAFLNSMVGTGGYNSVPGQCDTYGVRNASPYNSSVSRATYAASIGRPNRWTCLNNYYEVPKTSPGPGIPANNFGSDTIPAGAKSAAQLIWDAAQQNNISPKVLLTTIQKESAGPLTTDDWPWQSQYTYAMGAHCPDTAPCDTNYAGFSIQISESAALFRYYLNNMNQPWWPYKKPGNNAILYNPSSDCGSSAVNVLTYATAALYTYTPYQPNQAALNNLYGSGDGCSAYGNRNFWRIYSNWFGPTTSALNGITMTNIQQPNTTPARGETVTYTYSLTNNLATAVTLNAVGVVGRAASLTGANRDFNWQGPVTLQPDVAQQFTFTSLIRDVETMYVWPAVNYQGSYTQYNNWGATLVSHPPNFAVSGLTFTNPAPAQGENLGVSFTVTNTGAAGVDVDAVGVIGRLGTFSGANRDIGWQGPVHFNAGETKTFTGSGFSRTVNDVGTHYYWIGVLSGGNFMQYNNWGSTVVSHAASLTLSQPLTMNSTNVYAGQSVTFTATLKNNESRPINYDAFGIPVKFYDRYNYDAAWIGPGTINAGAEVVLSGTRTIDKPGPFTYWVSNYSGGTFTTIGSVKKFTSLEVSPNFSVSGLTFANTSPAVGQNITISSFSVTNNLPIAIDVDAVGVIGRLGTLSGANRDIGWQGPVHFDANQTKTFTTGYSRTITDLGTHYYWIGILYKGSFMQYNNWGSTVVSH
jgi:hypothetical protein